MPSNSWTHTKAKNDHEVVPHYAPNLGWICDAKDCGQPVKNLGTRIIQMQKQYQLSTVEVKSYELHCPHCPAEFSEPIYIYKEALQLASIHAQAVHGETILASEVDFVGRAVG